MERSVEGSEPVSQGSSEVSWASGRARMRGGHLRKGDVRAGVNVREAVWRVRQRGEAVMREIWDWSGKEVWRRVEHCDSPSGVRCGSGRE